MLPWLVLVISLAVTHQLWQGAQNSAAHELRSTFDFRAHETVGLVEQRMKIYEQALHGARGLFSASISVERHEFSAFVKEQHLDQNYPGIQGLCFSVIVPLEQKKQHIAAIRKQGFPEYAIRPEGERDIYTSAIYLEPFSGRNQRAFGFDNYTDPVRRAAMEQARDSGNAAISGKVTLLHEDKDTQQAGFRMYLPVYRNGAPHDSLAERRANIVGWVYAPFRADDLMNGILDEYAAYLDFEIYDGEKMSPETLLYDSDYHPGSRDKARFQTIRRLDVAGHTWMIAIRSHQGFEARLDNNKPQLVASVGIGVSMLFMLITWLLVTGRYRAIKAAKTMNHELIRSEAHFRAFSDNLPAAVYLKDRDGRHVMVNRSFEQIVGKPQAGILGKTVFDLFPSETACAFAANDHKTLESKQASTHEESVYVDSRERIYQSIKFPVIGENGEVLGTGGISIDITKRKQAEKEIEFKSTLLSTLNEHSPDGMLVVDESEEVLFTNKRFADMWGIAPVAAATRLDEHVLKTVLDKLADPQQLIEKMEYLDTHRQETTMDELLLKDGRTIDCYSAPIIGSDAKYYGRVRYLRDITGRKQAEEALRASEERWRFALEGAGDGVWEWNLPGGEMIVSRVGKAMFGFAEDEIGNDISEWQARVHPEDKAYLAEDTLAYLHSNDTYFSTEYRLRCKDGSWKWTHVRGMVVSRDPTGQVLRMIGTHTDITERKAAEEALHASKARMRAILDNSPYLIWLKDTDGRFVAINRPFFRTTGLKRIRDVLGKTDFDLWPRDMAEKYCADDAEVMASRQDKHTEEPSIMENGEVHWVETFKKPILDQNGQLLGTTGFARDITERKLADLALRKSEAKFRSIIEFSPVPYTLNDDHQHITYLNPAFVLTFGYTLEDIPTLAAWWPKAYPDPEYCQWVAATWQSHLEKAKRENIAFEPMELRIRCKNGTDRTVIADATALEESFGGTHLVTLYDITERKAAEESIRHLAHYDALTDLPNRTLFLDRLQQAFATARRDKARMALMFIDLDEFKPINDKFGHAVGDLLLKEVAIRILNCVRDSDTVARIGGDEFIVLLPAIETEQDAMVVADKIRLALCRSFELAGQSLHISSSIGIAIHPEHGSEEKILLKNADTAMYCAKENGRNNVQFYRPGMHNSTSGVN